MKKSILLSTMSKPAQLMHPELTALYKEYQYQLSRQLFRPEELDYGILDKHFPYLHAIEQYTSSCVSIFDCFQRKHIVVSHKFEHMLGWDVEKAGEDEGTAYMDERVHPEDLVSMLRSGVYFVKYILDTPPAERKHYKMVSSYRTFDASGRYVRVVEQSSPMEFDSRNNVWLVLSLLDVSASYDGSAAFGACMVHTLSGKIIELPNPEHMNTEALTNRETEILKCIAQGLISKEIAGRLFISEKTVNTHRQRIIAKLNATNSSEAVKRAYQMGIL